jgi:valyl-tRNA synthetase
MPFVTEELWQRLPKISRVSPSPTIMIAKYPIFEQYWTNEGVEKLMDILKEGIHAARSLRSDYRVPNHMKVDFYFRTNNNELEEQLISEELDFCTLARANFLKPASMIPASSKGLCTRVINDQWSIIVCLDGVIDVEAELTRLDREKCRLSSQVELYTKKCTVPEYESKVPESVRISNGEKLDSLQREMTETIHAINTFLTMKETR